MKNETVLGVMALLLTACAKLSGDGDVISSEYASFEDASKERAFKLGWLPQALPLSATNIAEVHNIDSGEVWTTFRYTDDDIRWLTKHCTSRSRVELPNASRVNRDVPWWPTELTDEGDSQSRKQFSFFSCSNMGHAKSTFAANVAIDDGRRKAWYWLSK